MTFSIRDLLWLTLAVGLSGGWWLDHASLTHEAASARASALRLVEEAALEVSRDKQVATLEEENQWLKLLLDVHQHRWGQRQTGEGDLEQAR